MKLIFKAPCSELTNLENLWLQLSNVACNLKCKHCFLDCHHDIKKKNFLSLEKIKSTFKNIKHLEMIYLTGGEPFVHPNIIEIIQEALKISNVRIFSNGTLINEKKVKILKNLENNSKNKISFVLSLDHFTEGRNDEYRARGVFKKVLNSIKLLQNFNFEVNIACVNLKNEEKNFLKEGFNNLFIKNNILINSDKIKILPLLKMGSFSKFYTISAEKQVVDFNDIENIDLNILDCKTSRVLTSNGIYSCPALVNDPRGKVGETISNFAEKVYLETETCASCVAQSENLFG